MNVFIDTNVLLDFFRTSSADLEELRKLAWLETIGSISLFVSAWGRDEFFRNREGVIAVALKEFQQSKFVLKRPYIVRLHKESVELERLQSQISELVEVIVDRVTAEAVDCKTKADQVVNEMFSAASIGEVSDQVLDRAIRRTNLGKPPGKNNSCGDAIHWEWLLSEVPQGEDLHVISRDGDFESKLTEGKLKAYLVSEWKTRKKSECYHYRTLASFLEEHFANIKLADQMAKGVAIEKLEQSGNFATTHNAIERLSQFDDFTKDELLRIIEAYKTNNQIAWILDDSDVKEFAHKLVSMAYSCELIEPVFPIEEMLNELEVEELQWGALHVAPQDRGMKAKSSERLSLDRFRLISILRQGTANRRRELVV